MSSARINISNYYTCGRSYGIDRTMPAIMTGRMSEYQWEQFCDEIDTILAPLNKLRCILGVGTAVTFIGFIIVMITMFTGAQSSMDATDDSFYSDSGPSGVVFFAVPLALMIALILLSCWASAKARRAFSEIVQVCEEASSPKLSLHLRDDRIVGGGYYSGSGGGYRTYHNVYIVASLADINVVAVASDANRAVPSMTTPDLEAGRSDHYLASDLPVAQAIEAYNGEADDDEASLSVKKRMKKLNKIKHLLTEEEYERKRDEILADI